MRQGGGKLNWYSPIDQIISILVCCKKEKFYAGPWLAMTKWCARAANRILPRSALVCEAASAKHSLPALPTTSFTILLLLYWRRWTELVLRRWLRCSGTRARRNLRIKRMYWIQIGIRRTNAVPYWTQLISLQQCQIFFPFTKNTMYDSFRIFCFRSLALGVISGLDSAHDIISLY